MIGKFIFALYITLCYVYSQENGVWDCNRQWPDFEIFLPVRVTNASEYRDRNDEWRNYFLKTFLLFWPIKVSKTKLNIMLDEELKTSPLLHYFVLDPIRKYMKLLGNDFPPTSINYNVNLNATFRTGHDRQQYLMYTADMYTKAEFIGFVDSDVVFHSYVDREDIFENGKPVIKGRIGRYRNVGKGKILRSWAKSTYDVLGLEEPMVGMSYFPMVVKTSHLKELREFISNKFKKTFEEAFYEFSAIGWGRHSQFNIMCAYLFWKKRDQYTWYVHDTDVTWDGFHPVPAYGQWADKRVFDPSMLLPKPFVANHLSIQYHVYERTDPVTYKAKCISQGMCYIHVKNVSIHYIPVEKVEAVKLDPPEVIPTPDMLALRPPHADDHIWQTLQDNSRCEFMKTEIYYKEMHRFGDLDLNFEWFLPNESVVLHQHAIRDERIKNCIHHGILID